MKGGEPRDRVAELVADRVRIATEWIQGGLFDSGGESFGLVLQPTLVGGADRPTTASRSRAWRHPSWSRVRSTMMVTARSCPTRLGRQLGRAVAPCPGWPRGGSPDR